MATLQKDVKVLFQSQHSILENQAKCIQIRQPAPGIYFLLSVSCKEDSENPLTLACLYFMSKLSAGEGEVGENEILRIG
jgi:hypothetical protein